MKVLLVALAAFAGMGGIAACSASGDSGDGGFTADAGAPTEDGAIPSDGGDAGEPTDSGQLLGDVALDAPPPVGEVYGHSATTLYKLEPYSKAVQVVGTLDCVTITAGALGPCGDGLWDIALDKDGNMYGTSATVGDAFCSPSTVMGHLVQIDKKTAHCSIVQSTAAGSKYPNSLTFVPEGTLDAAKESLVGYVSADYVQIDKATGTMTTIGSLNPNPTGTSWYSSGDIISVKDGKTFLTAKPDASSSYTGTDTLLEIDPKTGQALKVIGDTKYPKLWGVGFWAGTAYGFSGTGQLCAIDVTTGQATPIALTGIAAGLQFWGAGSTTVAPLVPPK